MNARIGWQAVEAPCTYRGRFRQPGPEAATEFAGLVGDAMGRLVRARARHRRCS